MDDYPLVKIEWVDSCRVAAGEWVNLSDIEAPNPHKCISVGFLISENEKGKILVPTVADVEHRDNSHVYGGVMIPVSAILSEIRLTSCP